MNNLITLNASVVSRVGLGFSNNNDNFYINGRYAYEHEMNNTEVSIENSGDEYIFAVSDSMDRESPEKIASVSMMKELKKFHERIKGSGGDLSSKLDQLKERVEEINNVIYSMSIGDAQHKEAIISFTGLFFHHGKVAALNTGNSKVYLLRDGNVRQLTGEVKKAEKLLKMGIITNEQAKVLSGRFGIPVDEGKSGIQKSSVLDVREGDVFLLCTDGISGTIDDEKVHELLSANKDTGFISNLFVKEALNNGEKDSMSAMVIKVIEADSSVDKSANAKRGSISRKSDLRPNSERNSVIKYVAVALTICLVITGIFFALYKTGAFNSVSSEPGDDLPPLATTSPGTDGGNSDSNPQPDATPAAGNEDPTGDTDPVEGEEPAEPGTYVVKSGDTLEKISRQFYNDPAKYTLIMEKNGITDANQLEVGQVLIIP